MINSVESLPTLCQTHFIRASLSLQPSALLSLVEALVGNLQPSALKQRIWQSRLEEPRIERTLKARCSNHNKNSHGSRSRGSEQAQRRTEVKQIARSSTLQHVAWALATTMSNKASISSRRVETAHPTLDYKGQRGTHLRKRTRSAQTSTLLTRMRHFTRARAGRLVSAAKRIASSQERATPTPKQ